MHEALNRFPPSFADNPWSYGFALFGLALLSSLALAVVTGFALESRRDLAISAAIGNIAVPPRPTGLTLLGVHRQIVSGLLLTILSGAVPNVLILLAWGESSDGTMLALFQIDRFCDGFTIVPFLYSLGLMVKAGPAVDHLIAIDPVTVKLRPTWGMVRDKMKIVGVVLCISAGVTLYKSQGLS